MSEIAEIELEEATLSECS